MAIFLSGVIYALLFPKFNLSFLAPVFAVPLLIYLKNYAALGGSKKRAFFYGLGGGTLSWLIILYWIYGVLLNNGAGYTASVAGWFLLSLYLGIYWGLFSLTVVLIFRLDLRYKLFLTAAAWTILEYVRAHLITGFGWLLAGYSVAQIPLFIQIASVTGVYGISFIILYLNAGFGFAFLRKKLRPLIAPMSAAAILSLYGYIALKTPYTQNEKVSISILQGNISQYEKWDDAYEERILDIYKRLYKKASLGRPDVIIWPETALPVHLMLK